VSASRHGYCDMGRPPPDSVRVSILSSTYRSVDNQGCRM
jgi:hypothetical protein